MIQYGMLHCHSEHSFLDSTLSVSEMVLKGQQLGCPAIALTDHGSMDGMPSFFAACLEAGIKPIAGVEAYIEEEQEGRGHLIILACDTEGYRALCHAVTESNTRIYVDKTKYAYPRMNKEILERNFGSNSKGYGHVVMMSACVSGIIARIILQNYYLRKQINKITDQQKKLCSPKDPRLKKLIQEQEAIEQKIKSAKKSKKGMSSIYGKNSEILKEYDLEIRKYEAEKKEIGANLKKLLRQVDRYKRNVQNMIDIRRSYGNNLYEVAKNEAEYYRNTFPNFYIELQFHGLEEERISMPLLLKIARELSIPVVVSNDVHLGVREDAKIRRYYRSIRFKNWCESDECEEELYIKTDEELESALASILPEDAVEEGFQNIGKIVEKCSFQYPEESHYPVYDGSETFDELLEKGVRKRIDANNMLWDTEHRERLAYEKQVIEKMGFTDYFLIIRSLVKLGKMIGNVPIEKIIDIPEGAEEAVRFASQFESGVGVGPGRGSAVGSLVAYLLEITEIDPIQYGLLFERFLNTERITMPDIDSDFRPEIIPLLYKYLQARHGFYSVSKIMTVIRQDTKEAIHAAGRMLSSKTGDKTYSVEADRLAALYTDFPEQHLNGKAGEILYIAKKIKGAPKSRGIHAAGVIISDKGNINDYFPLMYNHENNCWAVQCNMEEAEAHGLLKADLLKLICLSICNECIQLSGYNINWENIPFEDKVFEKIYCSGNLDGIFQCESTSMQKVIKDFGPDCIEDLILLIAAYRPGPMDYIPEMTAVKHGKKKASYIVPQLEPILSVTYGAIIYQEQVMQIFQLLAGYSLRDADLVRRAMSKKKTEKLIIEREAFVYGSEARGIKGCIKNGISEERAIQLFQGMIDFAKYAFNKSHAVAYAVLSYRTAYLKYHYPLEYITAYLNYRKNMIGKISRECLRLNIPIMKPDINLSGARCRIYNGALLLGLSHIESVAATGKMIVDERALNGPYKSREDFISRIQVKKNVLQNLDLAGVFRNVGAFPTNCSLVEEKKLFGSFLDIEYLKELTFRVPTFDSEVEASDAIVGGIITEVKVSNTKKGSQMVFVELGTADGIEDIIFFQSVYIEYKDFLKEGMSVIVEGEHKKNEFGFSFIARKVKSLIENDYYVKIKDYNPSEVIAYQSCLGGKLLILQEDGTFTDSGYRYRSGVTTVHGVKSLPKI